MKSFNWHQPTKVIFGCVTLPHGMGMAIGGMYLHVSHCKSIEQHPLGHENTEKCLYRVFIPGK